MFRPRHALRHRRGPARGVSRTEGLLYQPGFLSPEERAELVRYLETLHPLWEDRFSARNPPPPGQKQRRLLRPVYWLGNWQFPCPPYYPPPRPRRDRRVPPHPF